MLVRHLRNREYRDILSSTKVPFLAGIASAAPDKKGLFMRYIQSAFLLMVVMLPLLAFADEQSKAEKQLNRISAMAADLTGRRMVNLSMAAQFGVKRSDLARERRENNLNYGSLFVVHQLAASGTQLSDITAQLRAGKSLKDVANAFHADWKLIGNEAKKLNGKIEDNLYNYFLNSRSEGATKNPNDPYDPVYDGVDADLNVAKADLEEAQDRYVFWRDRAAKKSDSALDHGNEKAARQTVDPVRKGGPQADQAGNTGPTPR